MGRPAGSGPKPPYVDADAADETASKSTEDELTSSTDNKGKIH